MDFEDQNNFIQEFKLIPYLEINISKGDFINLTE